MNTIYYTEVSTVFAKKKTFNKLTNYRTGHYDYRSSRKWWIYCWRNLRPGKGFWYSYNYDILLEKLEYYGIRGIVLKWFTNYLTNRKQTVKYKNIKSEKLTTKCGVPQGSVLGPLLFLIYMNDIPICSDILSNILFADDTNLFSEQWLQGFSTQTFIKC